MALSPNYGWAEPDNSSLVKNGAQDIRALGDAIDASLWNVGYGQAGKNKIINSDFSVWQRGTSFTTATGGGAYTADRFEVVNESGANVVTTRQIFTPGSAPVAGYEGQYFLRMASTSATGDTYVVQRIEDVRSFAGQTVTISFWAKCSTGTVSSNGYYLQGFGTGGSSTVFANTGALTITTSWQRFSKTVAIPSVSGKTIGANSSLTFQVLRYAASNTVDIWGVQVEYGSIATPFQTATGTLQGEIDACKRYTKTTQNGGNPLWLTMSYLTAFGNSYSQVIYFETPLRTTPTMTFQDNAANSGKMTTYNAAGISSNNITPTFSYVTDGLGQTTGFRVSVSGNYVYGEIYAMIMNSEL